MGYRRVSVLGADLVLAVPDALTQRARALATGRARVSAPGRKVTERPPAEARALPPGTAAASPEAARLLARLAEVGWWYHTIELGHGVATPGGFDHRPYLPLYPIPADLSGLRVLDVATFDGFWAFEFARRGAAEVVALDVARFGDLDLPAPARRAMSAEELDRPVGRGFEVCRDLLGLGGRVRREALSVYDLSPARPGGGPFDLVFVGDLLLHLMNPARALQAVASVVAPGGRAVVVETFDPNLPGGLVEFQGGGSDCVWWRMGLGALERMVRDAGFGEVRLVSKFRTGGAGERPWLWHAAFVCAPPQP